LIVLLFHSQLIYTEGALAVEVRSNSLSELRKTVRRKTPGRDKHV
jgi:hypothetical protein